MWTLGTFSNVFTHNSIDLHMTSKVNTPSQPKRVKKAEYARATIYLTNANSNDLIWPSLYNTDKKWSIIDTLLISALLYEFSNVIDALRDFGKNCVREKLVPWNHSYLKYVCLKNCLQDIFITSPRARLLL